MNGIILYTLPTCGKCEILKTKMKNKKIKYSEISELEYLAANEIDTVPVLEIDGNRLNFVEANSWINQQ